jgi:hypothetical protein
MTFGGSPIPTQKRIPARAVADLPAGSRPSQPPAKPPDLEARIAAFESVATTGDFDRASWFWIILLGVALPLVLLAIGWCV